MLETVGVDSGEPVVLLSTYTCGTSHKGKISMLTSFELGPSLFPDEISSHIPALGSQPLVSHVEGRDGVRSTCWNREDTGE